jgi:hypothetical protein
MLSCPNESDYHNREDDYEYDRHVGGTLGALPIVYRSTGSLVFALERFADQRNSFCQTSVKVVIPKVRLDVILGDVEGGSAPSTP